MAQTFNKVIVVGSGPVGLLLAYMLAQRGVEVVVLEAEKELNKQPRGIAYGPSAVAVLKRAGLLDEIHDRCTIYKTLSWRKLSGESIATLKRQGDEEEIVALPVPELTQFLLEKLELCPTASIHFDRQVIDVGTQGQQGWVEVRVTDDETQKMFGDFVLGCDGGRSAVRKAMLGHEFPGFTWEKPVVALDIIYDMDQYGWSDANWIVDRNHWALVARISSKERRWRVAYGEESGLTSEQFKDRLPKKLEAILPGHPSTNEFELLRFSPYVMNQRCVKRMKMGRVLLAGDAAHVCNPMGGLGLTGGIADAGSLIDCLYGILDGKADLQILDKYDEIRRQIYETHTDPTSSGNLKRMMQDAEVVAASDPFILNVSQQNEEFLRMLHNEGLKLSCDMTQFYNC